MISVTLPELGEGIERAVVASWHFQVGDAVREGDDLVELVTDKASFNVPIPRSGIVKEILISEGEEPAIGETLAIIEDDKK